MKERKIGHIKPFRFEDRYIIPLDVTWEDYVEGRVLAFDVVIDKFGRLAFLGPTIVRPDFGKVEEP